MSLTIVSARYANPQNTAAELLTVEHAAVMVSERDRPELWVEFKTWEEANSVAPYVAAPAIKQETVANLRAVLIEKGILK